MSFLNLRKTKKEEPNAPARKLVPKEALTKKLAVASGVGSQGMHRAVRFEVLQRPHITEKATAGGERGVYVFEVSPNATKGKITDAVSRLYKVSPVKVTIVTMPKKRITVKGRTGFRRSGKKAYVYLKHGDKIEVV